MTEQGRKYWSAPHARLQNWRVWILMLGLTAYFDDSGSDDNSELVTTGGPVMSRIQAKAFSLRWMKMLVRFQIEPPLHIKEFYGNGRYATWYPEFKRALCWDISRLVNEHKLYSVSIAISQADFKSTLSEEVRKSLIGPYAFAFFSAVSSHQTLCKQLNSGSFTISYLGDSGFGYQDQLMEAHSVLVANEIAKGGPRHTGGLKFESDDNHPPLQAADVMVWASRQIELHGALPEGFEPLREFLLEHRMQPPTPHAHIPIPLFGIKMLANPINAWISRKGIIPNLADIVR